MTGRKMFLKLKLMICRIATSSSFLVAVAALGTSCKRRTVRSGRILRNFTYSPQYNKLFIKMWALSATIILFLCLHTLPKELLDFLYQKTKQNVFPTARKLPTSCIVQPLHAGTQHIGYIMLPSFISQWVFSYPFYIYHYQHYSNTDQIEYKSCPELMQGRIILSVEEHSKWNSNFYSTLWSC